LSISSFNYHPIIGLVVLAALFLQPFIGLIHHSRYKKLGRRQIWSYLHMWNGRLMIPLGIINGGLGLKLAGASNQIKIAYAVVAAVMFVLWVLFSILSSFRRRRQTRRSSKRLRKVAETPEESKLAPPRYK
jgi:hypothetical protein